MILNVRYTSLDGGDKLRKIAANSVTELSQDAGLFAVFDGARFPERVVQNHALYPGRSKLSYGADPGFPAESVSTNGAKSDQPLSSGDAIGTMKSPAAKELDDLPAGD